MTTTRSALQIFREAMRNPAKAKIIQRLLDEGDNQKVAEYFAKQIGLAEKRKKKKKEIEKFRNAMRR